MPEPAIQAMRRLPPGGTAACRPSVTCGQAPAGNRAVKPHTVGDGPKAAPDPRGEEIVQIAVEHLPTPHRPGVDVEEEGARVPAHATALQVKGLAMRVGQAR